MDWTTLPGPSAFLNRVIQRLRETYSVIAYVSPCLDSAWCRQLKGPLEGVYSWIDLSPDPESFYTSVGETFGRPEIVNAHDLLASGINANLFCVEQPSGEHWPAWTKLLTDFAKAHATVSALERNTILFVLHDAQMVPPNENLIAASYLHDFTRPEDCFFHACQRSTGTGSRSLEEEVRIHVCSELALWDFELCSHLMGLSLEAVLEPLDALCAYARSAEADVLDASKRYQPCRKNNNGSAPEQTHAVILAMKEDRAELRRRVWRGQVQVLFPLIEDQRCKLLDLIRSKFPAVLGDGGSVDETLEIGPLVRLMRCYGKCPRDLLALAGRLKKMRDKIAHLEVCSVEDMPTRAELIK